MKTYQTNQVKNITLLGNSGSGKTTLAESLLLAGGVISRAIMHEKFRSRGFSNVMKDALILFLIAVGLIIVGALLEMFVTSRIVHGLVA